MAVKLIVYLHSLNSMYTLIIVNLKLYKQIEKFCTETYLQLYKTINK